MSGAVIPNRDSDGNIVQILSPFASKTLSNGGRLFKRIHGIKQSIGMGQELAIRLSVPYSNAKITAVEIVNAQIGDTCDFKVYDTPEGALSTIPNLMLNQFGFNVNLTPNFHREESSYDADVIKDMVLEVLYKNNSGMALEVGINFVLHEVK